MLTDEVLEKKARQLHDALALALTENNCAVLLLLKSLLFVFQHSYNKNPRVHYRSSIVGAPRIREIRCFDHWRRRSAAARKSTNFKK